MGMLQDNKSRKKISNDPNNTKWTRDTTTFGQKILRAQGWQPGQFLGAQDAPHAALHSAASASYIRVVLKDDMKGLGFDRAKEDEVTGLDVFSDVLSRLNGKSESAVQEDRDARLAIKTHRYVEMRWGPMRFVRGGLLVGDKLEEVAVAAEAEGGGDSSSGGGAEVTRSKKDKKSKKRKAEEQEQEEREDSEAANKKDKKRRRKDEDEDAKEDKKKKRRKEDKDKRKKKSKKSSRSKDGSDDSDDDDDKDSDERAAKKKAKKERKRERREKKEEKKRRKAVQAADSASSSDDSDSDADASGSSRSATVTPAATSGTSTPLGNRNFVRSRYIAQKRQAVMDATALKQIFMVKA
ncbi:G-patch RNA maturation protein [Cordyceps fumosorosea ARSEF 2679]|uniref:PinX1-related protein 1 n=1 Tax=Cordyceps fumosorosea (strain ARSEF 2679) TaxID=1081104 RepID=A0A168DZX0_CORFA|nr:G-patch RNA maturation protein [Cordyceps fumosorosea ARSEF 2679]OAA73205.1 G-patch RNA maturation protein [Cordyceps fumosorosea ARSEF 2679]